MLEDITGQEIKNQFKSNSKLRIAVIAVGGVLLAVIAYFAYVHFMWNPKNEKSKDAYWEPLNYAVADSTDVALEGFLSAKKKYDGKIGGEVSQFLYASQLMKKGEFKKAISELEEVEVEDTYVSVLRVGLIGDCQSELGKYEEASKKYVEAAEMIDNDFVTPMYLKKAALCAEELKDYKSAVKYYNKILDGYPAFSTQNQIEKYLARASKIKVK